MEILSLNMGHVDTNTYIIKDEEGIILIDPCLDVGRDASRIDAVIGEDKVNAILLTHGHFDHISGVDYYVDKFSCPVYIHKNDYELLYDERKNLSSMTSEPFRISAKAKIVSDTVKVGTKEFKVIETFGHTRGSITYILDKHYFDGDFIFKNSIGRCDLPFGDETIMNNHLKKFVEEYQEKDIILYPGHGPKTTLEKELKHNPYLQRLTK